MHKNATTTPASRAALKQATGSDCELARQFNLGCDTVRKWRQRDGVQPLIAEEKTLVAEPTLTASYSRHMVIPLTLDCLLDGLDKADAYGRARRQGARSA